MTIIQDLIHTRELYRKRYVPDYGWVTSSTSFIGRVQPKWTDAINRTSQVTMEELFLNNSIFTDAYDNQSTFVDTNYTIPSQQQAIQNAQNGIKCAIGDRIIEPSSGRIWMVHSVAEYRDARLWHDEIICREASQLDAKWIEPITILNLNSTITKDDIMNQYVQYDTINYSASSAFGAVAFYDTERFLREESMFESRSAKGKVINEPILIHIDADFNIDYLSLIQLRGSIWMITFIRETMYRVYSVGLKPYKESGAVTTLTDKPTIKKYV
jgi:hypothetical protein